LKPSAPARRDRHALLMATVFLSSASSTFTFHAWRKSLSNSIATSRWISMLKVASTLTEIWNVGLCDSDFAAITLNSALIGFRGQWGVNYATDATRNTRISMLHSRLSMTSKQRAIIEAAIIGLQAQSGRLKAKIAELRSQLDGSQPSVTATTEDSSFLRKRRKMSLAARKRIAEAQRRRWAAIRERRLAA
jgi:hypothetical protein